MDLHVFGQVYGWSATDVLALTPRERAGLLHLIEEDLQRAKARRQLVQGRSRRG